MFNSVPVSMFFVSKSEPRSTECSLEMVCSTGEEHGSSKITFRREFL